MAQDHLTGGIPESRNPGIWKCLTEGTEQSQVMGTRWVGQDTRQQPEPHSASPAAERAAPVLAPDLSSLFSCIPDEVQCNSSIPTGITLTCTGFLYSVKGAGEAAVGES